MTRRYKTFIELKTSSVYNDKEQIDVLERMIGYLRTTDKDSMVSFVWAVGARVRRSYQSEGSLYRAKCVLLDILETLSLSMWDMTYTVKNVVFEVIFRLLKRSELSDLSLLGGREEKE